MSPCQPENRTDDQLAVLLFRLDSVSHSSRIFLFILCHMDGSCTE